jgi:hypothetical protein
MTTRVTAGVCAIIWLLGIPAAAQERNAITVVSLTPAGPWRRGVPLAVVMRCDVTLATMDSADVALGFSIDDPHRFRMLASTRLHRGRQQVTLNATVLPVDWSATGAQFGYIVNIRPIPQPRAAGVRSPGYATVRGQVDVIP